jgi:hypothetical protein
MRAPLKRGSKVRFLAGPPASPSYPLSLRTSGKGKRTHGGSSPPGGSHLKSIRPRSSGEKSASLRRKRPPVQIGPGAFYATVAERFQAPACKAGDAGSNPARCSHKRNLLSTSSARIPGSPAAPGPGPACVAAQESGAGKPRPRVSSPSGLEPLPAGLSVRPCA